MPPYSATHSILGWVSMTRSVREIRTPHQALQRILFRREETQPTETVEFSIEEHPNRIARFVKVNAEAIAVDAETWSFRNIITPNIRIKRPMNAANAFFKRTPGSAVMIDSVGAVNQGVAFALQKDLTILADLISNTIEWMCAMALRGSITVDNTSIPGQLDLDAFTIDFGRAGTHSFNAGSTWGTTGSTMLTDIHAAKRLIYDDAREIIGIGIAGRAAADRIRADPAFTSLATDSRLRLGFATLAEQYSEEGLMYIGNIGGVDHWEYAATVLDPIGNTIDLIRPDYIEYASTSPSADFAIYYGAIPDFDALSQGMVQTSRFAKSWRLPDPSGHISLAQSRPLPVPKRPNATVSISTA